MFLNVLNDVIYYNILDIWKSKSYYIERSQCSDQSLKLFDWDNYRTLGAVTPLK